MAEYERRMFTNTGKCCVDEKPTFNSSIMILLQVYYVLKTQRKPKRSRKLTFVVLLSILTTNCFWKHITFLQISLTVNEDKIMNAFTTLVCAIHK